MRTRARRRAAVLGPGFLLGGLVCVHAAGGAHELDRDAEALRWRGKVHPAVLEAAASGPVEFMAILDEQADLGEVAADLDPLDKEAKGAFVYHRLREVARRSQAPLLADLERKGIEHRGFWIANTIWVRGDLAAVETVASRPAVRQVATNPSVELETPTSPGAEAVPGEVTAEWNLTRIGADAVWALGYDGTGVVIGGQDTGYAWDHPALVGRYRGNDGLSVEHAYHWHDAIHAGGGSCGADSVAPCDDHNHGTHTMGIMVGDDGASNRIGVSPGARWIGCRNMDVGVGTVASYTECFQWFVAPTDANGQNPDPAMAPHVINNSWSCPPSEGCAADTLRLVVENTRAAGIVVVTSVGNSGSSCGTVDDPPAIYDASLSVGATDGGDVIASFSSRGPVTVDQSGRLKPDVSAPGVSVRSSVPGDAYASYSGTSMAAPHVAGLVALLLDARPDLVGKVTEIEQLILASALPLTSSEGCGGDRPTDVPNHVYGAGRIDALALFFDDADADASPNLEDCRPLDPAAWSLPSVVADLTVAGDAGATLSWSASAAPDGQELRFDVLRSVDPADFSGASCLLADSSATVVSDAAPASGLVSYLVRARNACGGVLGPSSSGARTAGECP